MIKLNAIPLDYTPRSKILPELPEFVSKDGYREPEMSEFESAFLCGVLKEFRPKKILEVGRTSKTQRNSFRLRAAQKNHAQTFGALNKFHPKKFSKAGEHRKCFFAPHAELALFADQYRNKNLPRILRATLFAEFGRHF